MTDPVRPQEEPTAAEKKAAEKTEAPKTEKKTRKRKAKEEKKAFTPKVNQTMHASPDTDGIPTKCIVKAQKKADK